MEEINSEDIKPLVRTVCVELKNEYGVLVPEKVTLRRPDGSEIVLTEYELNQIERTIRGEGDNVLEFYAELKEGEYMPSSGIVVSQENA